MGPFEIEGKGPLLLHNGVLWSNVKDWEEIHSFRVMFLINYKPNADLI